MNLSELKKPLVKIKRLLADAAGSVSAYLSSDEKYDWSDGGLNRRLIMTFGFLFVIDYMMFCYHSDKNIFDIFPSIPAVSGHQEVTLYLPDLDGSILEETRMTPTFADKEHFVRFLFNSVVKGSMLKNTALAVPAEMNIRHIWITEEGCTVDCEITELSSGMKPLQGSEELFKSALTKTIRTNIPEISSVLVLTGGIERRLW